MEHDNRRVSEAIADTLFGTENAGRPVYTLATDSDLTTVSGLAGLTGDPVAAVAKVVRATLAVVDPGVPPFKWQALEASRHRRHPLETPPALPLLVVLTLAAERMQAGSHVAPHNYYSRLHSLLRTSPDREQRVEEDYRRHADELWGSLNMWLEAWDGERGIPTAYSVGGHPFIGLPMSQAVVRQYDRTGLHEFFALDGLAPGLRLAPSDMDPAMDPYVTRTPSPFSSNLRHLWTIPAARERITQAACLELEAWDGSGHTRVSAAPQLLAARLLAFLRTFPRSGVEFNLMLPHQSTGPDIAHFKSASGKTTVPTVVGPGGSTRLSGVEAIRASSLIGESLAGELGADEGRAFTRRPRRVVPLRWDDLQGAYVEVERIALAEDSLVLARTDVRHRVEDHLKVHARPGWRERPVLVGMPEDWLIYDHVQVVSGPANPIHADLLPLAPRARTSLTLQGGFVLPGLLRKWSSLEPPEIVALAAGASTVSVRVYAGSRIDSVRQVVRSDVDDELAVVPLRDRDLPDGEYVVAMFVDGNRPSSTALLRLRSADTPQFSVDEVDIRLVYSPESAITWPLSAGSATWPKYVNGARLVGLPAVDPEQTEVDMPEFVPRVRLNRAERSAGISIGTAMATDSCMSTGMHRFQLPPVKPDQHPTSLIQGECTGCGLVKRFAGTPWAARKRDAETAPNRVVHIPPIADSRGPDFQVAFDALNHVGHGSYGAFERIAAQIEGSGLFADSFLRRQEVVGHIDVARDAWLQVIDWAVNSATLLAVGEANWVLIGSRSRALTTKLREVLVDAEITESVDAQLARVEVSCEIGPLLERRDALGAIGVTIVERSPALALARSLPQLGDLAMGLKRIAVPSYRTLERWDTASASWEVVHSLASVGAYRLKDFRSLYVVRSADDVLNGTAAVGAAQLVKHIANMWAHEPLVGYHSKSESVVAPLGADLPGLYGRAASICSGRAPREIMEQRVIQYPSVPRDVAGTIFAKLSQ